MRGRGRTGGGCELPSHNNVCLHRELTSAALPPLPRKTLATTANCLAFFFIRVANDSAFVAMVSAEDDLWQRILQQNEEMDAQTRERQSAEARLAEHEQYAADAGRWQQTSYQPRQQQHQQSIGLSAAAIDEREREIDRQLELERSLVRGQEQQEQRRGSRGAPQQRSGGKLTHVNTAQKENRGKISLLPGRGGAPPSSCGAPSETGQRARAPPSTAASIPPSVAGSMAPSLRAPRPVHFTHEMTAKAPPTTSQGHQMDSLLNPVHGIRDQMRRAGVEPKDHVRENRQLLKEMASVQHAKKQHDEMESQGRRERDAMIKERSRVRAQQALADLGAMDISEDYSAAPPSRGASAGRRSTRPPPTGQETPAAPAPKHAPGQVPAYLQRRKAEWQAEADSAAAMEARLAECPPGTRLVGPDEKARIIEKLSEERAKAALELRQMPFVIKTTASQIKKDQLEARLEEIAGAEEAYRREKVFVPADM